MWFSNYTRKIGKGPCSLSGRVMLPAPGRARRTRSRNVARSDVLAAFKMLYSLQGVIPLLIRLDNGMNWQSAPNYAIQNVL
jgi:hypothetical protein